jgi:predicted Zn-dependent protease
MALTAAAAKAQERSLALVRDAEIEHILAAYATPLFQAAGLSAGGVRIHLVQDDTINAFVAGGQRIFVFTGLILATRTPGELVGVLAHETGHIRGGHLSRTRDALANAQTISILAALLGGVAAAASGDGNAAGAGLLGGAAAGQQLFLSYSRTQESAADQSGLKLMEQAGWSPRGLMDFMQVLDEQELILGQRGNPYLRSHPLGYERVQALETLVNQSPLRDRPDPPELVRAHRMMQAKLFGFTRPVSATFRKYPIEDQSDPARYARAVALMRQARTDEAVREILPLVQSEPGNPYFHELHGQILLEGGRVDESLAPLRRAADLSDHSTISVLVAQALVARGTESDMAEARAQLEEVVRTEADMPAAWQQLAIVYGRQGEIGRSMLASAEHFLLTGQPKFAREQVDRALRTLPAGTPEHFRAQDLEIAVQALERQLERR